jgi:hypothetical protein
MHNSGSEELSEDRRMGILRDQFPIRINKLDSKSQATTTENPGILGASRQIKDHDCW